MFKFSVFLCHSNAFPVYRHYPIEEFFILLERWIVCETGILARVLDVFLRKMREQRSFIDLQFQYEALLLQGMLIADLSSPDS